MKNLFLSVAVGLIILMMTVVFGAIFNKKERDYDLEYWREFGVGS